MARGSTQHRNLGWTLTSKALGCRLLAGQKLKTEFWDELSGWHLGPVLYVRTGMTLAEKQFTLYSRSVK
jgi:hypothetical protein